MDEKSSKIGLGFIDGYIHGIEELEKIEESELTRIIKSCSDEELLRRGREFVSQSKFTGADVVFLEGITRKKIQEISDVYLSVLRTFNFLGLFGKAREIDEFAIGKSLYCMAESTRMHAEKNLPDEDLLVLERLVDEVPYRRITIPNREEFQKIYERFKEYCVNVFLRNKK